MEIHIVTHRADLPSVMRSTAPAGVLVEGPARVTRGFKLPAEARIFHLGIDQVDEDEVEEISDWIWDHIGNPATLEIAVNGNVVNPSEPEITLAIARASLCHFSTPSLHLDHAGGERLDCIEDLGTLIMSVGVTDSGKGASILGAMGHGILKRLEANLTEAGGFERALKRIPFIDMGFESLINDFRISSALHTEVFRNYHLMRLHARAGKPFDA